MSDIKLFRLTAGQATELQGSASDLEKPLQTLIEANLGPLLSIRFLASEHSTGKLPPVALAWMPAAEHITGAVNLPCLATPCG